MTNYSTTHDITSAENNRTSLNPISQQWSPTFPTNTPALKHRPEIPGTLTITVEQGRLVCHSVPRLPQLLRPLRPELFDSPHNVFGSASAGPLAGTEDTTAIRCGERASVSTSPLWSRLISRTMLLCSTASASAWKEGVKACFGGHVLDVGSDAND